MHHTPPPYQPPSAYVQTVVASALRDQVIAQAQNDNSSQSNSYNYGEDAYGTSVYNGNRESQNLINTGTVISLTVTVACLLILSALVVRFWKRPRDKTDQDNK